MHILLLTSFYPSPARPGVGIFFRDQELALRRAGHKVGVLVAPRIRESIDFLRRNRRLPNLKSAEREADSLYRMHWGWFPRVFPHITGWLHANAGLRAYERYAAEQGKPDVIHAHNTFYSGYIAATIKARHGVPVVLTEHSTNFLRGRVVLPGQKYIVRKTLDACDARFGVGAAIANALDRYTTGGIHIMDNVVDTAFFMPGPFVSDRFTFSSAGRLIPHKGVDHLLHAFAAAFAGQDVRLVIGGDGPQQDKLRQLADDLNIREQVTFTGWLDRDGVRKLYQECHVLVSTSRFETFGLTLAEAMSCGRPVIATRSGGPEGFVTEETGILVPVDNLDALTTAMVDMRANYQRYDPEQIRAYAEGRFSEATIARRLTEVYEAVRNSPATE